MHISVLLNVLIPVRERLAVRRLYRRLLGLGVREGLLSGYIPLSRFWTAKRDFFFSLLFWAWTKFFSIDDLMILTSTFGVCGSEFPHTGFFQGSLNWDLERSVGRYLLISGCLVCPEFPLLESFEDVSAESWSIVDKEADATSSQSGWSSTLRSMSSNSFITLIKPPDGKVW